MAGSACPATYEKPLHIIHIYSSDGRQRAGPRNNSQHHSTPQPQNGYWELGDVFVNAGDIDNDGVDDILVGRPSSHAVVGNYMGSVAVYSGKTTLPIHSIVGNEPSAGFGGAVCAGYDFNSDGFID